METHRTPIVVAGAIVGGIGTGIAVVVTFVASPSATLFVLAAGVGLTVAFAALVTGAAPSRGGAVRPLESQEAGLALAVEPNARVGNAVMAGAIALATVGVLFMAAVILFVLAFVSGVQQGG
jgi:hypothetical protein